jgi:hypothetical protein
MGLFAIADIPRGTRVIAEPPLLAIDSDENPFNANDIIRAFEDLVPSQQKKYLALHEYLPSNRQYISANPIATKWHEIPEMHRNVLQVYHANA